MSIYILLLLLQIFGHSVSAQQGQIWTDKQRAHKEELEKAFKIFSAEAEKWLKPIYTDIARSADVCQDSIIGLNAIVSKLSKELDNVVSLPLNATAKTLENINSRSQILEQLINIERDEDWCLEDLKRAYAALKADLAATETDMGSQRTKKFAELFIQNLGQRNADEILRLCKNQDLPPLLEEVSKDIYEDRSQFDRNFDFALALFETLNTRDQAQDDTGRRLTEAFAPLLLRRLEAFGLLATRRTLRLALLVRGNQASDALATFPTQIQNLVSAPANCLKNEDIGSFLVERRGTGTSQSAALELRTFGVPEEYGCGWNFINIAGSNSGVTFKIDRNTESFGNGRSLGSNSQNVLNLSPSFGNDNSWEIVPTAGTGDIAFELRNNNLALCREGQGAVAEVILKSAANADNACKWTLIRV